MFHPTHLMWAVNGRIESTLLDLPKPFKLIKPKLNQQTSPEKRQPKNSPNHSLNWTIGDARAEIVDTTTGITANKYFCILPKAISMAKAVYKFHTLSCYFLRVC